MNSSIELLNAWGARFVEVALPMLWQSSVLIAVVFAVDFLLRRKIRPAVRYTLWFVIFIKLLIPPTLALPTGAAWWLRTRPVQVVAPHMRTMMVNYSEPVRTFILPAAPYVPVAAPRARLSRDARTLLTSIFVSVLLAGWSAFRWRQIARCVRATTTATGEIQQMLAEASRRAGLRKNVRLCVTAEAMSPAVCGLLRPVVLLPQSLIERLTPKQLEAVLLHELIHLRRCDVWVNCAQTLLQIVYWWHPLLWFANARVRRVREEAVDDAVMFALSDEAEIYAPTLLEVAKLAFNRPLATLGLVGILESRNALRHRIERLLNFTTPRRVGVSAVSVICIAAFTALAVPMGEPPARALQVGDDSEGSKLIAFHAKVNPEVFIRNVKARASETMLTTNDAVTEILASILDGFGVDCTPPRDIAFDSAAGEVTLQNTPEALQIAGSVIRELNLRGGEHVLNPPYDLKKVVIDAKFYQMSAADVAKLNLESGANHHEGDLSPWWDLPGAQFIDAQNRAKEIGLEPMMSPRVQTSHGVTARMFMGDTTNNIELECVPYVHGGAVSLSVLARTTGEYAPKGKGWPDSGGHTNCAIFVRMKFADGDGAVLRAAPAGTDKELIVLLKAKILEPLRSKDKVPFLGDLPAAGRVIRSGPNAATTNTSRALGGDDNVKTLVANGKLLYQLGQFDEAEKNLNQALSTQPDNQAALYYLNLIKQSRTRQKIDEHNVANSVPTPNPYARTNTIHTSPERKKIYDKLTNITFDKISFPGIPLPEVVRNLTELTWRRDIDQKGINFLINYAKPSEAATAPTDANGKPVATTPASAADDVDLHEVKISLEPGLRDVRLLDVLEAIVKSADHPIKYSLLDYGIEFSIKGQDQMELHTRTFKVDPNTFFMGLQNVAVINFGAGTTNATVSTNSRLRYVTGLGSTEELQLAAISFFNAVGVNLYAPKSIFFNARLGTLTVRATDADLELIEQAINTLNTAPPEVTVKVRFVEVNQNENRALGFNWYLGNILMGNNKVGGGSTQPSSTGAPGGTTPPPSGSNGLLTSGLRSASGAAGASNSGLPSLTGILTDPQFKVVLRALEKRDGATLLSEGEVTTLSGRPANFRVLDIKALATEFKTTVGTNGTSYGYEVTNMPFGTTLDVAPYVCADGYTIQMTVTPTVTEFLGYDNPKDYVKYDENLKHGKLPLPKTRIRQMTTSVTVWDGQTLVLGNLNDETIVSGPNGAKLRQSSNPPSKKQLLIFITPTIIDQAGNRVHNEPVSKDYYDSPQVY